MTEPEYKIEDGKYAYYQDGERLFETEEVAILFDKGDNILLKHGAPEFVNEHHLRYAKAFTNGGMTNMADDLVVIQGKFELPELNKIVQISDYIGRFYEKYKPADPKPRL